MPMSWCGAIAATMRSVETAPVVPRSGERKIAILATGPAFSMKSPICTTSLVTVALARKAGGGALCASAALLAATSTASVAVARRIVRPILSRIMMPIMALILLSASVARSSAAFRRPR